MSSVTFAKNGQTRKVKVGFSWSVLFFNFIPIAFRRQWNWFFLSLVLCIIASSLAVAEPIIFGFLPLAYSICLAWNANKTTARWLAKNDWTIENGDVPRKWRIRRRRRGTI